MALATIALLEDVIPTVNPTSAWVRGLLEERGYTVRGRGLMLGIEVENTLALSRALMRKGFIVLPAGEQAEVLGLTPPLTITDAQMMSFLDALDEVTS